MEAGLIVFLLGAIIVPAMLFLCYLRIKYGKWLPNTEQKDKSGKEVINVTSDFPAVADNPWARSPWDYYHSCYSLEQQAKTKSIKGVIHARTTTTNQITK
jgi:hypothetical protein